MFYQEPGLNYVQLRLLSGAEREQAMGFPKIAGPAGNQILWTHAARSERIRHNQLGESFEVCGNAGAVTRRPHSGVASFYMGHPRGVFCLFDIQHWGPVRGLSMPGVAAAPPHQRVALGEGSDNHVAAKTDPGHTSPTL